MSELVLCRLTRAVSPLVLHISAASIGCSWGDLMVVLLCVHSSRHLYAGGEPNEKP